MLWPAAGQINAHVNVLPSRPKSALPAVQLRPYRCGTAGSCAVTHGSVARWPGTHGSGVARGPGTTNTGNVGREEYCKVEQAK